MRMIAMDREPDQREARAGFRRVGTIVAGVEAEPAVVGDKTRMSFDHRRLVGLEVGIDKCGRAGGNAAVITAVFAIVRPVVLVRRAEQRAADFVEVDRQLVGRNAERVLEIVDEGEGVERPGNAFDGALDGGGIDAPVAQCHRLRAEAVLAAGRVRIEAVLLPAVGQRLADGLGHDHHFMRILGDGLAHEQAVDLGPDRRVEMIDHMMRLKVRLKVGQRCKLRLQGSIKRGIHG